MEMVNERNNFIYLVISLLVLIFASAVSHSVPGSVTSLFLLTLEIVSLVLAYISLDFGPRQTRALKVLLVLLIISSAISEARQYEWADIVTLTILLLFFVAAATEAARKILLSGSVQVNIIVGSLAIYLLIGLIWANLYLIILELAPGAFNGINQGDWGENFPKAIYFSYVTLTSLGYGEITPNIPLTRMLAFLEAITGTFYMAVVVASLIGAHSGNGKKQHGAASRKTKKT